MSNVPLTEIPYGKSLKGMEGFSGRGRCAHARGVSRPAPEPLRMLQRAHLPYALRHYTTKQTRIATTYIDHSSAMTANVYFVTVIVKQS